MTTPWPKYPIADLCTAVVDCLNRTAPTVEGPTPYRMIRTTNVRNGFVDLSNVNYVDETTYRRWTRRQTPRRGDIILTREAPLGEVGLVRDDEGIFLGQRLVSYRVNPKRLDGRYLLYTLLGPDLQGQIQALGSGSTVAHMRVPDAKRLLIPMPSLEIQQRIGAILAAYDELIEVNRRRIALLEEMARRLFEEWFVHFRFPGHEDCPIEAPGPVLPTGWHIGIAGELIDLDPTTNVAKEGRKPFIPMNSLSTTTSLIEEIDWKEGNSGAKFKNGDTLFARITPCLENGKTGLVRGLPGDGLGFGSTEFIVMRGRKAGPVFCYLLARHDAFREHARRSMSGASGRQRARTESLRTYQLHVPPADLLRQFERIAWPLLEFSGSLGVANKRLAASRDLLLPRLISGEFSVASAERELEAVA
jgi:type I restriction enzyme S subunit